MSKDTVQSHERFVLTRDLHCRLLADPAGRIIKLLGVAGPLGFANRTTFVIDKSGVVRRVFENVSAKGHAAEVLAFVKTL